MSLFQSVYNNSTVVRQAVKPTVSINVAVDMADAMILHLPPLQVAVVIHGLLSLSFLTIQKTEDGCGVEILSPHDIAIVRLLSNEEVTDEELALFCANNLQLGSTPAAMSMAYIMHSVFSQPVVTDTQITHAIKAYGEFLGVSTPSDRQSLATQIASRAKLWLTPVEGSTEEEVAHKAAQFRAFCTRAGDLLEAMLPYLVNNNPQPTDNNTPTIVNSKDVQVDNEYEIISQNHQSHAALDNHEETTEVAASENTDVIPENTFLTHLTTEDDARTVYSSDATSTVDSDVVLCEEHLRNQMIQLSALTPMLFMHRVNGL